MTIELDGDSHAAQVEYDQKRTAWLTKQGYREMRFWNREVLQDIESVLEQILEACVKRQAQPSP